MTLIGFAADPLVVVIAKHPEDIEFYGCEFIRIIKAWLWMVKLNLVDEKTEGSFFPIAGTPSKFELVITRLFQINRKIPRVMIDGW